MTGNDKADIHNSSVTCESCVYFQLYVYCDEPPWGYGRCTHKGINVHVLQLNDPNSPCYTPIPSKGTPNRDPEIECGAKLVSPPLPSRSEQYIVSFNYTPGDIACLLVATQEADKTTIVNGFYGHEAIELADKLKSPYIRIVKKKLDQLNDLLKGDEQ